MEITFVSDDKLTLEQYFQLHSGKAVDYSLRVSFQNGKPEFYIHPSGVDGETWTFNVEGNALTCTGHTGD